MGVDVLSRIICDGLNLRAYTAVTSDISRDITSRHDASPPAALSLARAVNAAALLSASLKPGSRQSLAVKFYGSGPLKELNVQADALGNMRGYIANPYIEIDSEGAGIGFGKLIGAGFLSVIKQLGMKEPYSSTIPLQSGDIAKDMAYYLTFSEQVPSAIIIAVKMDANLQIAASGGILIQVFPDTDPSVIMKVEQRILANQSSLGQHLFEGGDINSFLAELLDNSPMKMLETTPLRHKCGCSHRMLLEIMGGFSVEELDDMITKDNGAEIECTFCRKKYRFTAEEIASLRDAHGKSH
jgi:molecular chaperone Hsp33